MRMKRLLLLSVAMTSLSSAATILTNTPAWNGSTTISPWGNSSHTPTYGETVTVPVNGDNILSSFSFEIFGAGTPSLSFDAYVQGWSGTATTGSPLFTGAGATLTASGASAYTFSPGVALTAGSTYLLYFSILGLAEPGTNIYSWGATSPDTYSGGSFFFTNVDTASPATGSISDLNTATWSTGSCCGVSDLAFSATFSAPATVPEPASAGLFLGGIGLLAAARSIGRRRRVRDTRVTRRVAHSEPRQSWSGPAPVDNDQ